MVWEAARVVYKRYAAYEWALDVGTTQLPAQQLTLQSDPLNKYKLAYRPGPARVGLQKVLNGSLSSR